MHLDQQNLSNYDIDTVPLPTSVMAVVSLVSGILGFILLPILASIVALITGYLARQETHAVPPRSSGDGMAVAGIVMGWIQIGLAGIGVCGLILSPFWMWLFGDQILRILGM
jgi:hypothetical protein